MDRGTGHCLESSERLIHSLFSVKSGTRARSLRPRLPFRMKNAFFVDATIRMGTTCHILYTKILNTSTLIRPTTDITDSSNVQVANVSFIVSPKYSFNNHNNSSFTWDAIKLLAAVARKIKVRFTSDVSIIETTRPTVVRDAAVAELRATRNIAAMIHANNNVG